MTAFDNSTPWKPASGAVLMELVVALFVLAAAVIPLSYLLNQERQLCRAQYYRAVAMEVVDGELEVLAAGEWRACKQGSQSHPVRAEAAKNLPAGRFLLTVQEKRVRLEWLPDKPGQGGRLVREVTLR